MARRFTVAGLEKRTSAAKAIVLTDVYGTAEAAPFVKICYTS
jgi:hypothetical protein